MKYLIVIALVLLASCSKQAKPEFAPKKSRGNIQAEVTNTSVTLIHNSDGTFTVDFGGATDVVMWFFRGGDELSSPSGNVIPLNTFNPMSLTFTSTFTRTYYQVVLVTGSTERDANGILGADWQFTYSNVVQ